MIKIHIVDIFPIGNDDDSATSENFRDLDITTIDAMQRIVCLLFVTKMLKGLLVLVRISLT